MPDKHIRNRMELIRIMHYKGAIKMKRKYSIFVTIEVGADVENLSEDNAAVHKDCMKKLIKHIWRIRDLNENSMAIAKIHGNENEPEIANKVINDKEAKKAVAEAMDVLRQIYDYDD